MPQVHSLVVRSKIITRTNELLAVSTSKFRSTNTTRTYTKYYFIPNPFSSEANEKNKPKQLKIHNVENLLREIDPRKKLQQIPEPQSLPHQPSLPVSLHEPDFTFQLWEKNSEALKLLLPKVEDLKQINFLNLFTSIQLKKKMIAAKRASVELFGRSLVLARSNLATLSEYVVFIIQRNPSLRNLPFTKMIVTTNETSLSNGWLFTHTAFATKETEKCDKTKKVSPKDPPSPPLIDSIRIPEALNPKGLMSDAQQTWTQLQKKLPGWQKSISNTLQGVQDAIKKRMK